MALKVGVSGACARNFRLKCWRLGAGGGEGGGVGEDWDGGMLLVSMNWGALQDASVYDIMKGSGARVVVLS